MWYQNDLYNLSADLIELVTQTKTEELTNNESKVLQVYILKEIESTAKKAREILNMELWNKKLKEMEYENA